MNEELKNSVDEVVKAGNGILGKLALYGSGIVTGVLGTIFGQKLMKRKTHWYDKKDVIVDGGATKKVQAEQPEE